MKTKHFNAKMFYTAFVFLLTALMISCGKDNKTADSKDKVDTSKKTTTNTTSGNNSPGKEFFYAKSKENNIACADCHSDGSNKNNLLTKYFSNIQGANKRTSTYHGLFTGEEVLKNAGGATLCWESYLKMKTPMTVEQINLLNEYYNSVATTDSPLEIKYETIALPTRDKSKLKQVQSVIMGLKGDAAKGEQTFNNSCGFCHGEKSTIKKVPSILEDFDGNIKSIVYKVRLGDAPMPFFHLPALTDQDIADLSAYIMKKNGK